MKIIMFGDCIIRGICSYYLKNGKTNADKFEKGNIPEKISKYFNCQCVNAGMRRSGMCRSGNTKFPNEEKANPLNSIVERIEMTDLSEYTHLIVFGGTNDYGNNAKFGFRKDKDKNCFKGAIAHVIDHLKENYPNLKIYFLTPTQRYTYKKKIVNCTGGCYNFPNKHNHSLGDYCQAIVDICKDNNIPCLDFREFKEITDDNWRELFPDALHPSIKFREKITEFIINFLKDKL